MKFQNAGRLSSVSVLGVMCTALLSCNSNDSSSGSGGSTSVSIAPTVTTSPTGTTLPPVTTAVVLPNTPGTPVIRSFTTDVLVFTGSGTWATEIPDAEALLTANGATYQEATSSDLNAMSAEQMASYGMIFIPGGEGSTEAESVSAATHANLRTAVQSLGLSYVGFCAGAFVAVAPAPTAGQDVSYGFGVVNGALLNYYTGPGTTADFELTLETFANGASQNILWYGGPVTPDTGVIAKYPTGDPAISEMWSGNGLVIIAGVHPDLSQASLNELGVSPDASAQSVAWQIFDAAIKQQPITPIF
jgi:glutamine amidotransferase-like uncharacterized protein